MSIVPNATPGQQALELSRGTKYEAGIKTEVTLRQCSGWIS